MSRAELADFLRRRREALSPELGTQVPGRRRRTPGLRREEVAELAGMSANYYERLEQARAPHPSPQVLDALGTALHLTTTEREHLSRLAGRSVHQDPTETGDVPPAAMRLLERLGPIPAYVVDQRLDILAWNEAICALLVDLGDLLVQDRNVVRLAQRLGGSWCAGGPDGAGEFARQLAAELRETTARFPADRRIGELVDSHATRDADFAATWRDHDVRLRPSLAKRVNHPDVGEILLDRQTLQIPGSPLRIVLYTVEPGSPSAARLDRLIALR